LSTVESETLGKYCRGKETRESKKEINQGKKNRGLGLGFRINTVVGERERGHGKKKRVEGVKVIRSIPEKFFTGDPTPASKKGGWRSRNRTGFSRKEGSEKKGDRGGSNSSLWQQSESEKRKSVGTERKWDLKLQIGPYTPWLGHLETGSQGSLFSGWGGATEREDQKRKAGKRTDHGKSKQPEGEKGL